MFEIEGKYTKAKIYTDNVEPEALSQIYSICNHPAFEGESVRIMPDCHAGAGCVIGFTSTNNSGKIIPNLIGVDIGCFTGDTIIPLINGERKSLKELDGKSEIYVYSMDKNNQIVVGKSYLF